MHISMNILRNMDVVSGYPLWTPHAYRETNKCIYTRTHTLMRTQNTNPTDIHRLSGTTKTSARLTFYVCSTSSNSNTVTETDTTWISVHTILFTGEWYGSLTEWYKVG